MRMVYRPQSAARFPAMMAHTGTDVNSCLQGIGLLFCEKKKIALIGDQYVVIANVHELEILAQSMMGKRVLTLFWLL
jgi:hypothetical protein